ncbi:helix-turn-helix transcriptional regulator [Rhodovulum sp. YNF3179]|uniref:helix-turn-helix transcriptional regulator n=1 Tax=Rhodovulum sp. YNF3179 TaxID=3425127 RepID=UPI003D32C9D3
MRFITLQQLRNKMGGRSRNAIFADIERGLLPPPKKFGDGPGAKNYWNEAEVDRALETLTASQVAMDEGGDR